MTVAFFFSPTHLHPFSSPTQHASSSPDISAMGESETTTSKGKKAKKKKKKNRAAPHENAAKKRAGLHETRAPQPLWQHCRVALRRRFTALLLLPTSVRHVGIDHEREFLLLLLLFLEWIAALAERLGLCRVRPRELGNDSLQADVSRKLNNNNRFMR
jgi:hypothetical protein